jgi:hypothetical protein
MCSRIGSVRKSSVVLAKVLKKIFSLGLLCRLLLIIVAAVGGWYLHKGFQLMGINPLKHAEISKRERATFAVPLTLGSRSMQSQGALIAFADSIRLKGGISSEWDEQL